MNRYSLGWRPQVADIRDYTPQHEKVTASLSTPAPGLILPSRVDNRKWCSPIYDQGQLGSCTAHAAAGLVEYFERKASGRSVSASRLFLYKATRNLTGEKGDTGATLRDAMKALVMLGAPPEEYYPYEIGKFDNEPPAFVYALAQDYRAVKYFRLDPPGESKSATLQRIKQYLFQGIPSMFGFSCYQSAFSAAGGMIAFPAAGDPLAGGHAIGCFGYDDSLKIGASTGALLIRNSWGPGWGQGGYGYLAYDYVLKELADDFWALTSESWVDLAPFVDSAG